MKSIFFILLITSVLSCSSIQSERSAEIPGLRDQAFSALKEHIKKNYDCDDITILNITVPNGSDDSIFFSENWKIRHCDKVTVHLLAFLPVNLSKDKSNQKRSYLITIVEPKKN